VLFLGLTSGGGQFFALMPLPVPPPGGWEGETERSRDPQIQERNETPMLIQHPIPGPFHLLPSLIRLPRH